MAGKRPIRKKVLTPLQERFAQACVTLGNATKAYAQASGSRMHRDALSANAQRLLRLTSVRLRIDQLQREAEKRNDVQIDCVVQELARIGFSNMLDYLTIDHDGGAQFDLKRLTRDQAAAITQIETDVLVATPEDLEAAGLRPDAQAIVLRTSVKLADKLPALNALGKHLGMFSKHNHQLGAAALASLQRTHDEIDSARRVAFALGSVLRKPQKTPAPPAQKPKSKATKGSMK